MFWGVIVVNGTMLRNKIIFLSVVLVGFSALPGGAFQLTGSKTNSGSGVESPSGKALSLDVDPSLNLGDGGDLELPKEEGMDIWIPGLGVVGKMPKLDFGLEMLYGSREPSNTEPPTAQELEKFGSDFAIKGTIKRKF